MKSLVFVTLSFLTISFLFGAGQLQRHSQITLNNLIDEIPRKEIAEKSNINMNTLDTQIRRLRIKMVAFLKDAGFEFRSFDKYE